MKRTIHKNYPFILLAVFLCVWIWGAINPVSPEAWMLENILVVIAVPTIIILGKYFRFSNISYTCIVAFMILHMIGAHYTYAEAPLGSGIGEWFGSNRNIYDRIVHFSFGFLWVYPVREVLLRVAKIRGFWSYVVPLEMAFSFSAIFEIFEWFIVVASNEETGVAFLATQGDIWDAQKDMALAALGAFVTLSSIAVVNWFHSREFRKEMRDSFTIGERQNPVGEISMKDVMEEKKKLLRKAQKIKKRYQKTQKKK
ncbi:MAG: DUF2238 domain-containing protein [Candidatus Moranbacteria bacterium]|nr:DUF2238 domain-containing protein [Candidatus Moranbacteria bacterium]